VSGDFNFKRAGRIAGGVSLIAVGIPMLALPGPGLITILGGVTLLSSEFEWARGLRDWSREKAAFLRKSEEERPSESDDGDQTG
jgi:hypothetical protein